MKRIIKIIYILLCFLIFSITISKANETIASKYYEVNKEKNIISRIEPETTIEILKQKLSNEEVQESGINIYKDNKEIKTGYTGTGMILKYKDEQYKLSVVGDFDGDGKATQVELTNIIRHIVGLEGSKLEGIYYTSGDLTGDGLVDQRDITKYIKYIVYGQLDLEKEDTTPPTVTLEPKEVDTDRIKVEAKAIDRESGMEEEPTFTFYIKKANEPNKNYIEKQNGKESILNLSGLEQETEYEVKVVTKDKAGNEASKVIKIKTEKVPDIIEFGNPIWNNGQAQIEISTNTKYKIEYKINEITENWEQTSQDKSSITVTNLKHNDVIYARLTDGINVGNYINTKIIDDKAPEINIDIVGNTSEITATAIAIDNETGIDENSNYIFYIKKETEDSYKQIQKDKSKICKITGLEANQVYIIKVKIEDKAGNLGTKEVKATTQKIPDATEAGIINFGAPIWNNGQAEITISTNAEYQIEYQINGTTGKWTRGTQVTNLNHNDVIYVRLTDGSNSGNYATTTIIDNIKPEITINTKKSTSEIKVEAIAKDNESGIDENATYTFYIKEASKPDSSYVEKQKTNQSICNIEGLEAKKVYTIKVEVEDKAGNKETKEITESTEPIPDATEAGSIIFSGLNWNNGQAEITISTNTEYQIEYQINGVEGTWIKSTQVTGLMNNDIVYARLTDGMNRGQYVTLTIVDTIKPYLELDLQAESYKITATAEVNDDESGIDENVTYKFYIKETGKPDSDYIEKQNTTQKICEVNGLSIGKNYTIKVEAADKAGNKGIIEKSILIPDNIAPIVDLNVIGKTSDTITVQANATDEGGLPTPTIYVFYIKETGADDSTYVEIQNSDNRKCIFTELNDNKDYTIKVTVADSAGNIGVKEISILTEQIPDATQAGAINFDSIAWINESATVTISTSTNYQIEYQVNGTSLNWIKGKKVTGLKHNDIIYARLTDGTNVGQYATIIILDNIQPEAFTISVTDITSTGFKISGSTIDNQTGIASYTYVVEKGGSITSENTKAKSNNINSVSYNDSDTANTSRSNNKCIRWRKWFDSQSKTSKNRTNESSGKRRYRTCNNGNTNE